jgi:uncharacterized membrane protein
MKEKRRQNPVLNKEKETMRLIGLSDGLFATVLTLLVLDLRIPDALSSSDGNINGFVKWIGPHLFSYLLTFLVGGNYWFAHHRDFDLIIHSDRRLLGYNLLFLLFIGLLPFSTASISLVTLKSDIYRFYWAIYSVNIIFAGLMLTLTWVYAVSHGFVNPGTTREQSRHITMRQLVIPAIFLISIGMQYLFSQAATGPLTLLLIPVGLGLVDRIPAYQDPETHTANLGRSEFLWRAASILPWVLVIGFAVWTMSF